MLEDKLFNQIPYDLDGGMAKNRFRCELLWGIIKFYSIPDEDCKIIFDYFCDIEIHFNERYEFYQIKTDKNNSNYTIDKLIKLDRSNKTILGKVYELKTYIKNSKVCVVSSTPLVEKVKNQESGNANRYNTINYTNPCEICLDILDKSNKDKISNRLIEELKIDKVDFDSIFFEYTMINLKNPEDALIAQTLKYSKKILGNQPKNLEGLCALIIYEVEKRACYEYKCKNYSDLIVNKSISKIELIKLIKDFEGVSDEIIHKVNKNINKLYEEDFYLCYKTKQSLIDIVERIGTDTHLKQKEDKILKYFTENLIELRCSELKIIEMIKEKDIFDIEDSEEDRIALIIYVLTKFKEGLS